MITGKNSKYKLYWMANQSGTGNVGILLAEKWTDKVFDISRVSDRILVMKVCMDKLIINIISVYAPQAGLATSTKDVFYDNLLSVVSRISSREHLYICGDFNGHIGSKPEGYEGVHGGFGYGQRNEEGERILEFATAHDLVIGNSLFKKPENHLVTYQSGGHHSQIDYILLRSCDMKHTRNIKVINSEECVSQHRLLVCDVSLKFSPPKRRQYAPKLRTWKLRDQSHRSEYTSEMEKALLSASPTDSVEDTWQTLKSTILTTAEKVCGWTKKGPPRKQTWWWDDNVNAAVLEKRRCWKAWKKSGQGKEIYLQARRRAKQAVHQAKRRAEERELQDIRGGKDNIFRIAKQMRRQNQDVIGDKCVRNDLGEMALDDEAKKVAWQQHYQRLLNVEFPWNRDQLPTVEPVQGPPVYISEEMVLDAVKRAKSGKAAGPSGIVAEMLKSSGERCTTLLTHLLNNIIAEGETPDDWDTSYVVNLYKGKGDALERGNYRGLKLLDQVMKVLERVVEKQIRGMVNIGDMQFGFMPGRGTIDAIFILRQLQEKYLARNKTLYFSFIDLEKAFDRVPREVLWWSMRRVGVEEWLVRVVQSMYKHAKSKVRVGDSYSEAFDVRVGVHQGSVLSPLLFIIVLEALSRESCTGLPWELLYADDLVIIADSIEELVTRTGTWKTNLEGKGLRVNMMKTKVLCSGKDLNVLVDSGKWPCGVCRKGVGRNSIMCNGCAHWIHKSCSGITGRLTVDSTYRCPRCCGTSRPIDGRPILHVSVDGHQLDTVDTFCYLGDTICAGGGCTASIITRCRSAWGKFRELLPILTNKSISPKTRGRIYTACVRTVMLYACECWAPRSDDRSRLERNDKAMVRWICGVKVDDQISTASLYERLGIPHIQQVSRQHRLRWAGHVHRSTSWTNRCQRIEVAGSKRKGRPRKTWTETVREDLQTLNLTLDMAEDRDAWREKLRDANRPSNTLGRVQRTLNA